MGIYNRGELSFSRLITLFGEKRLLIGKLFANQISNEEKSSKYLQTHSGNSNTEILNGTVEASYIDPFSHCSCYLIKIKSSN